MLKIKNTVSSDCIPTNKGKEFIIDNKLGLIQSNMDDEWFREIERIYQQYQIYSQSNGAEQSSYNSNTGLGLNRSQKIVNQLQSYLPKQKANLLDYGCGNGAFLRVLASTFPDYQLWGAEYDDKYKDQVELIPNVNSLITQQIEEIENTFDIISLIHLLEHIPSPVEFLRQTSLRLKKNGLLFIQLPYHIENPFELSIYDHASHFSTESITRVLSRAGFCIQLISSNWINKELSIIAIKNPANLSSVMKDVNGCSIKLESSRLTHRLTWLEDVKRKAYEVFENNSNNAIFGSSIAASWIISELETPVQILIDDDLNRSGQNHLGIPILNSNNVPDDTSVFIPLPTNIAKMIASRLKKKFPRSSFNYLDKNFSDTKTID